MQHARSDYNHIQDPSNKIPELEPVFLLRGQDPLAIAALKTWINAATKEGVDSRMIDGAKQQVKKMEAWQTIHGKKTPDMPLPPLPPVLETE